MAVHAALLASIVLSVPPASSPADTSRADSSRVVRTFEPVEVHAEPFGDPASTETTYRVVKESLERLPIDRLQQRLALEAGVVARGEDLHVRGGRAGELETTLDGIVLNEPFRGGAPELPLGAIVSAELLSGGMDADVGGALAGTVAIQTRRPDGRPTGAAEWHSDAGATGFDRFAGWFAGPILRSGLGVAAAADVTLDDTWLPSLRSNGRHRLLGMSFGWRAENRLLGDVRIATTRPGAGASLELIGMRRLSQPYDPAWNIDGWTARCDDPLCIYGPQLRDTPAPGYTRYRAADHLDVTDDRRLTAILSVLRYPERGREGFSIGWSRTRALTSPGGRDDESYLTRSRAPVFGFEDSADSEPFYVYLGDEPYFRKAWSQTLQAYAWTERRRGRATLRAGAGLRYDEVALRAVDLSLRGLGLDSLRSYHAWAPGGFAYAHLHWAFEGFVANGGLRLEYFTAGPQAEEQSLPAPAHGVWTWSPRLGIAYPMSDRDAFSLSYVRIRQAPPRDFLYDNRLKISNRQPIGNPALEPATAISWQAALKHRIDATWSAQAALFYRDLYGVIVPRNMRPGISIAQLVYEDDGEAGVSGVELSVIADPGSWGRLEAHYTWMDARGTFSSAEGVPYGSMLLWRPGNISQHPLDWDRRHTFSLAWLLQRGTWSAAWSTLVGSPLPWTPAERRTLEADDSRTNSRRLSWEESSALALRWSPDALRGAWTLGLDVMNVFDRRNERSASVDGYPNTVINTLYDDYGAYREETGMGGGAYWNDGNGDGLPGWRPVHDPRLIGAPRSVRFFLGTSF